MDIYNHDIISQISNGALCTVRVMTGQKNGSNDPQFIIASLRLAVGKSHIDNLGQLTDLNTGGIIAPVEGSSGRLGRAVSKDLSLPPFEKHPDTGCRIAGKTVPFWAECVQLCLRGHKCFSPISIVGWDVAVTSDGPILVEGNIYSGTDIHQVAHARTLPNQQFYETILSYIEH